MNDLPLLEKALEEAEGDCLVLTEKLLDNFSEISASLFALLATLEGAQPADVQAMRAKLEEIIDFDYVQAMRRVVEK